MGIQDVRGSHADHEHFQHYDAIFDVAQHVINASAGIIGGSTAIDASALESIEETLKEMELGPLFGLFLQSFVVQLCSLIR